MFENEFRIKCYLDGFSGKVSGEIFVKPGKIEQGEKFELVVNLKLELGVKEGTSPIGIVRCEPPSGFVGQEEVKLELRDDVLEGRFLFETQNSKPGDYEAWGTVHGRHGKDEEYAELLELSPVKLKITQRTVRIKECKADESLVSQGSLVKIRVLAEYPSEQKAKGSLSIELTGDPTLKHRVLNLESQKISLSGEREYVWEFKLPKDETGCGYYGCIVTFHSKELPATVARFANLIKVARAKDVVVEKIEATPSPISFGKKLNIETVLSNVGLEDVRAETTLFLDHAEIRLFEQKKVVQIKRGDKEKIVLEINLPEKKEIDAESLSFQIEGKIEGTSVRFLKAIEIPIKKAHEIKIITTTADKHVCLPDDEVKIIVYAIDEGSDAGLDAFVECVLTDKNGSIVFQETTIQKIAHTETQFVFSYKVAADAKAGTLDCTISIKVKEETKKVKFKSFLQIETPICLGMKLILDKGKMGLLEAYIREGEEIVNVENMGLITAHYLNSGKWIYTQDSTQGKKILFGLDDDGKNNNGKDDSKGAFSDLLFDGIVRKRKFPSEKIKCAIECWRDAMLCWNALADKVPYAKLKKMKFEEPICAEAKGLLLGENVEYDFTNMPINEVFRMILAGKLGEDSALASLDERLQYSLEESCESRCGKGLDEDDKRPVLLAALASEALSFLEQKEIKTAEGFARYSAVACYYYLIALMERGQKGAVPRNVADLLAGAAKDTCSDFLSIASEWKTRFEGYKKNMFVRRNLALCKRELEAKLNVCEIYASKGGKGKVELVLTNNGKEPFFVDVFISLPSESWAVVDPPTDLSEGVHLLQSINVEAKSSRKVELTIIFPKKLKNEKYCGIIVIKGNQTMHANETL